MKMKKKEKKTNKTNKEIEVENMKIIDYTLLWEDLYTDESGQIYDRLWPIEW